MRRETQNTNDVVLSKRKLNTTEYDHINTFYLSVYETKDREPFRTLGCSFSEGEQPETTLGELKDITNNFLPKYQRPHKEKRIILTMAQLMGVNVPFSFKFNENDVQDQKEKKELRQALATRHLMHHWPESFTKEVSTIFSRMTDQKPWEQEKYFYEELKKLLNSYDHQLSFKKLLKRKYKNLKDDEAQAAVSSFCRDPYHIILEIKNNPETHPLMCYEQKKQLPLWRRALPIVFGVCLGAVFFALTPAIASGGSGLALLGDIMLNTFWKGAIASGLMIALPSSSIFNRLFNRKPFARIAHAQQIIERCCGIYGSEDVDTTLRVLQSEYMMDETLKTNHQKPNWLFRQHSSLGIKFDKRRKVWKNYCARHPINHLPIQNNTDTFSSLMSLAHADLLGMDGSLLGKKLEAHFQGGEYQFIEERKKELYDLAFMEQALRLESTSLYPDFHKNMKVWCAEEGASYDSVTEKAYNFFKKNKTQLFKELKVLMPGIQEEPLTQYSQEQFDQLFNEERPSQSFKDLFAEVWMHSKHGTMVRDAITKTPNHTRFTLAFIILTGVAVFALMFTPAAPAGVVAAGFWAKFTAASLFSGLSVGALSGIAILAWFSRPPAGHKTKVQMRQLSQTRTIPQEKTSSSFTPASQNSTFLLRSQSLTNLMESSLTPLQRSRSLTDLSTSGTSDTSLRRWDNVEDLHQASGGASPRDEKDAKPAPQGRSAST